jgi:hypothetical protein
MTTTRFNNMRIQVETLMLSPEMGVVLVLVLVLVCSAVVQVFAGPLARVAPWLCGIDRSMGR